MRTKEETEKAFKTDLKALLTKYNAEIDLSVEISYMGREVNLDVTIPSVYDTALGECLQEYTEFSITDMVY